MCAQRLRPGARPPSAGHSNSAVHLGAEHWGGDRDGTYGVDGRDFLVPREIPPKDLRANVVRLISARFARQLTFVPNLPSSFEAPTTAYLGEDRKVFLIGSNSGM